VQNCLNRTNVASTDNEQNYNNPYSDPPIRSYTGPWSMMSRGSFNGPGGPHTRWQIPAQQGSSLGSLHTVRDKLQLGLTENSTVVMISKEDLATNGPVVAELTARSVDSGLLGLRVMMGNDSAPPCNQSTDPLCDGRGYQNYEMEVIDRMGADSFTPDSGVMIRSVVDYASMNQEETDVMFTVKRKQTMTCHSSGQSMPIPKTPTSWTSTVQMARLS